MAYRFHTHPGGLARVMPWWSRIRGIERSGPIENGGVWVLKSELMGMFPMRWVAEFSEVDAPRRFVDLKRRDLASPFAAWRHTHTFEADGAGCIVEDRVVYNVRGDALIGGFVERFLSHLFHVRGRRLQNNLRWWTRYRTDAPWRIAVSGATGMVGSALCQWLGAAGHSVLKLVRRPPRHDGEAHWLDADALEGCDAVVHLAGRNIGERLWSAHFKAELWNSRVPATQNLARILASLKRKPSVFITASGLNYYGDGGDAVRVESDTADDSFLGRLCVAWEEATKPAEAAGIRVVPMRFGIVMNPQGGVLRGVLPPYLLGVGKRMGSGRQYVSWIGLADLIGAILHAIFTDRLQGPVNVANDSLTNQAVMDTIGTVMPWRAVLPIPGVLIRGFMGELGKTLMLDSIRVSTERLRGSGFDPLNPSLESTLRYEIGL